MKIFKTSIRTILPFMIVFFFSCAVITVNIYFPARDVEKAYENLEDQLMNQGPTQPHKGPSKAPSGDSGAPQSLLNPSSWFVQTAYAEDSLSKQISHHIMKMPEVVNAYRRMGKRIQTINRLRDKRLVGESNSGLLSPLKRLNRNQALAMKDENHDRSIVILGMAKAIIEINHIKINKKNLDKVYPKAAAQFAKLRRSRAKPGWKIQLADGKWVVKR